MSTLGFRQACEQCGAIVELSRRARFCSLECQRRHHLTDWRQRYGVYITALQTGALVRPDRCAKCGAKCKPFGHHEDYSKPLDVIWVCRPCHRTLDKARRARLRDSLPAHSQQLAQPNALPSEGADQQRDAAGLGGNRVSPWLTSREAAAYIRCPTLAAFHTWVWRHKPGSVGTRGKRLYSRRDLDIALGAHPAQYRSRVA